MGNHHLEFTEGMALAAVCGDLSGRVNLTLEHRNATGEVLETRAYHNLITSAGKAAVAGLVNGVITNFFEYIAIGTGTNGEAPGDTSLQTEISANGGERKAATTSRVTTSVANDTAQLAATFTLTGGSYAVTESGILDSASTGVLLCRKTFAALNLTAGDSLTITWKIQVSAS